MTWIPGQDDDERWAIPDAMPWASEEDRRLSVLDAVLYGTSFVKRGDDGLVHRVDPTTIEVREL